MVYLEYHHRYPCRDLNGSIGPKGSWWIVFYHITYFSLNFSPSMWNFSKARKIAELELGISFLKRHEVSKSEKWWWMMIGLMYFANCQLLLGFQKNFRTFAFWTIENFYLRARRIMLANKNKIKKLLPETYISLELYSILAYTWNHGENESRREKPSTYLYIFCQSPHFLNTELP